MLSRAIPDSEPAIRSLLDLTCESTENHLDLEWQKGFGISQGQFPMGMERRSFCLHSVVLGISLSGCITNPLGRSRKGQIIAIVVDDVPEKATVVDFNDSRLDDMPLVKEMVRDAVSGGSTGRTIELDRAERLDDELREELPYHRNGGTGVYIRKGDTVVRVSVEFEG